MKKTVTIENWSIVASNKLGPYQAPEMQQYALTGEAYGQPDFEDGKFITTSAIINSNDLKHHAIVESHNTLYKLGEPSDSYILWCKENGVKKIGFGCFAL